MCNIQRKSKSIKSKGEKLHCLTQQPHHPPTALSSPAVVQGTEGLTLTPPGLLSISFEECTGFIKPTQTGAPPPSPPNTHTLQQHNKHPETKSSWRKAPWTQHSAGRRAQRASVMAGARWGQRQRLQCFWEEIQGLPRPTQLHSVTYSWRGQLRDLRWKAPRERRWEFSLSELEAPAHGSSHSQPDCQDLAPVKPARSVLCTRAKLVVSMQPTPGDTGQKENWKDRDVMWLPAEKSLLSTAPSSSERGTGEAPVPRWGSTWMYPDHGGGWVSSSFHTSCNHTTRGKIYITNDQICSWMEPKGWSKACCMSWGFYTIRKGFLPFTHNVMTKASALRNFFNGQTSSLTWLPTGQYMTKQYSINSGWYSVHN